MPELNTVRMDAGGDLVNRLPMSAFRVQSQKELYGSLHAYKVNADTSLPYDAWRTIDQAIMMVARRRLRLVNDLILRGLTFPLPQFMGVPVLEYQRSGEVTGAVVSMEPTTRGNVDRPTFNMDGTPIPLTHMPMKFSARSLEASRLNGTPLDITTFEETTVEVAETIEKTFILGAPINFASRTVYGLLNFPARNQVILQTPWTDPTKTPEGIKDDVLGLMQANREARHFGPYVLYIPKEYESVLDDDYSDQYGNKTIRQRLLDIDSLEDIVVLDFLPADNLVLLEPTSSTIQVIDGLRPTILPLLSQEFSPEFLALACLVPRLRADKNGRTGIAHAS